MERSKERRGIQRLNSSEFESWKEHPATKAFYEELFIRVQKQEEYIRKRKFRNDIQHIEMANLNMAIGKINELEEIFTLKPIIEKNTIDM